MLRCLCCTELCVAPAHKLLAGARQARLLTACSLARVFCTELLGGCPLHWCLLLGLTLAFSSAIAPDLRCRPAVVVLNHYGWLVCRQPGSNLASYACSAENDFNVLGE